MGSEGETLTPHFLMLLWVDKKINRIYSIQRMNAHFKGEAMSPSTTIHINDELLSRIDKTAKEKATSRNRFIINACEMALDNEGGKWPEDFFTTKLNEEDLQLLKDSVAEMERAIVRARRNRGDIDL